MKVYVNDKIIYKGNYTKLNTPINKFDTVEFVLKVTATKTAIKEVQVKMDKLYKELLNQIHAIDLDFYKKTVIKKSTDEEEL